MSQSGQGNLVSSLADPEGISKLHEETALTPIYVTLAPFSQLNFVSP